MSCRKKLHSLIMLSLKCSLYYRDLTFWFWIYYRFIRIIILQEFLIQKGILYIWLNKVSQSIENISVCGVASPTKHLCHNLFDTLFAFFLQWCRLYIKFDAILDKNALNIVLLKQQNFKNWCRKRWFDFFWENKFLYHFNNNLFSK